MRSEVRRFFFPLPAVFTAAFLLAGSSAEAQLSGTTDVNLSQMDDDQSECSISRNPANPLQLFAACNTSRRGLFAAVSSNAGANWDYADRDDKTIADGDEDQGPAGCCDPTTAWDTFGNLFLAYIGQSRSSIEVALSTDGGLKFSKLASFHGSVDQPTIVAANTSAPGAPVAVAVWIVWNQGVDPAPTGGPRKAGDRIDQMMAIGAAVTGPGAISLQDLQKTPQKILGTERCSFGDVAIAPTGAVVQVCQKPTGGQGPAEIFVNTDADGLGPGKFGAPVLAAKSNVGGIDFIPAQSTTSVDAEAGLAFNNKVGSPHFGRLYLVYTEEKVPEKSDLDVMLRYSDDNGRSWTPSLLSPPIRVNDDSTDTSQFLPRIAVDDTSGWISVCWHDCRKSITNTIPNTAMEVYCTVASPAGDPPTFLPNVKISDGASTSTGGWEFGDYSGLDYWNGVAHPIWADTSNGKPSFDVMTDRVGENVQPPQGQPQIVVTPRRTSPPTRRTPRRPPSRPGG
jgi:hypothetical protein